MKKVSSFMRVTVMKEKLPRCVGKIWDGYGHCLGYSEGILVYTYVKVYQIVHYKYLQFIVY